jgi:hypothetical protein
MAVLSILSPVSLTSYYAPEDGSVRQARLWFYKTQTLDPVPVYTDSDLRLPHSQPVLTSGSGRVPPVFVGEIGQYRVRTFDEFDVLLEDIDGLPPAAPETATGGGGSTDPNLLVKTGAVMPFYATPTQTVVGYVRLNGGTISPTAGPGTERANDDAMALFKWLWATDATLPVIPNRGTSSDGDWTAAKAITLPDFRSRSLFGVDGQGFSNTNRLTGTTFQTGNATTIGSTGGSPITTLTLAQIPSHNHSITDPGHTHSVTVANHIHGATTGIVAAGAHNHGGTTDTVNAHTHTTPYAGTLAALPIGSPSGGQIATGASSVTSAAGSHSHSITTDTFAAHTHTATTTIGAAGGFTAATTSNAAGITSVAVGGGGSHEQMAPFILVSWFMKL